MTDIDLKDRREHFKVEIRPTRTIGEPGEIDLVITHDGNDWTIIHLTPIERVKVIRALTREWVKR